MTESKSTSLPSQNVTIAGAFNPAILRPAWVQRNFPDLVREVEQNIPVPFDQDTPVIYEAEDLFWTANRERLVVYGPPDKIGSFSGKVLTILPHTPVSAAGVNFQYRGDMSGSAPGGPWSFSTDPRKVEALMGGNVKRNAFAQTVMWADGVHLSIRVGRSEGSTSLQLDLNFHLDASGAADKDRTTQLSKHVQRAPEFEQKALKISGVVLGNENVGTRS